MPDETTVNPAPATTPVSPAPEAPIPEVIEPVAPIQVEIPTESVPTPEPIAEPASGQMGGNDPIETAPIETQPAPAPVETPVATIETAPNETTTPESPEVTPSETTQPTQAEPVIEPTLAQTPAEVTPVSQVETPTPEQIPEPVVAQVPVSAPTPEPVITQTQTSATETATPTPAQVVASVIAPVVAPVIAQTFTKSIRELFTKAQLAIQNRKRKKIDRVMTLFAKQTKITNNEVEKFLHVSDSTATRYLTTLEKEGKVRQNAKKGHTTSYSKI
jgi:hypothetical protein